MVTQGRLRHGGRQVDREDGGEGQRAFRRFQRQPPDPDAAAATMAPDAAGQTAQQRRL
jgi:hypothetical protein